jgi:hypothetical protein
LKDKIHEERIRHISNSESQKENWKAPGDPMVQKDGPPFPAAMRISKRELKEMIQFRHSLTSRELNLKKRIERLSTCGRRPSRLGPRISKRELKARECAIMVAA